MSTTFENLTRFARDLREKAGIEVTTRRMGDQFALKIDGAEFFFDSHCRYHGTGKEHRAKLTDLVEDIDPSRGEE